jgi:uncharacterized protein
MLMTSDSYDEWYARTAHTSASGLNQAQAESVARNVEYFPATFVESFAPKLLFIVASINDQLIPTAKTHEVSASAGDPKKIVELNCGHFELYPHERGYKEAAANATGLSKKYL